MKLALTSKTLRTARAYLLFWLGMTGAFSLIVAFPVASRAALLIACGVFILITSWKLVETYIND